MRTFLLSAALGLAAVPALADQSQGTILAFDRLAHVIVLTDKTVWNLPADMALPGDLAQGDEVSFDFESGGENGMVKIKSMERLAVAKASN
jgi:hypothetical protein